MYAASVILLLLVFPLISVIADGLLFHGAVFDMLLVGKWFVFWSVGVRLFIAGLRQVAQPQFTAKEIFEIDDRGSHAIVRELGFANLSMGTLAVCSLGNAGWTVPAAIIGGLYYGLAGAGHVVRRGQNAHEQVAMVSDLLIFLLLAVFVATRLAAGG